MSNKHAVVTRSEHFAYFGTQLLDSIRGARLRFDLFEGLGAGAQMTHLQNFKTKKEKKKILLKVALALLMTSYPVQVPLESNDVIHLAKLAFAKVEYGADWVHGEVGVPELLNDNELLRALFPVKKHVAATTKANLKLRPTLVAARKMGLGPLLTGLLSRLAGRSTNDQATSAVIYAIGLHASLGAFAFEFAANCVLASSDAKGFSNALKALGANSDMVGARLVEGGCLIGRGVGTVDLVAKGLERCNDIFVEESTIKCDLPQLRMVVRQILEEELHGRTVDFKSLEAFWAKRWQWCVNGSHNSTMERYDKSVPRCRLPGVSQTYRRMYAEAVEDEPISAWDGTTYVTMSAKLENEKTRPLLACDTRSYFAFEHLLGPVSSAWLGQRVILDPGALGHLGVAMRIQKMQSKGGVNVMLDYDAFDTQHSTAAMQTVLEETIKYCGYPADLGGTLVGSLEKMNLFSGGQFLGLVKGTLMTGHRATTFFNSVLNAAYIRLAVGPEVYESLYSMHVGDDVFISAPTFQAAGHILDRARESGCRMNAAKQSVGTVGAEFLRMAVRTTHATGYFARSVASSVNGNWTSHTSLGPLELLQSAMTSCRGMMNRCDFDLSPIVARNLQDRVGMPAGLLRSLLNGSKAFEGGPVFSGSTMIETVTLVPSRPEDLTAKLDATWPQHATTAYLTDAATPIELYALEMARTSVKSAMLLASYSKTLASDFKVVEPIRVVKNRPRIPVGSASAFSLVGASGKGGVLTKYAILPLLKGVLTDLQLRDLVARVGGDGGASDIKQEAWGGGSLSKRIQGVLSYSDASTFCGRTTAGVIYSPYKVCM